MDPGVMPNGLVRYIGQHVILKDLGEVVGFAREDWRERLAFMRGHYKFEAVCGQCPGPLCPFSWLFCCPCMTWFLRDAFSKEGDCQDKAMAEAVVSAATWYLIYRRHFVVLRWAPKTLSKNENDIKDDNEGVEGNKNQESCDGVEGNENQESWDGPVSHLLLKENRIVHIYELSKITSVVSEKDVFARHRAGATGCVSGFFSPPVSGIQVEGAGIEGDVVHKHQRKDGHIIIGRQVYGGDLIGTMVTTLASTKRFEMLNPEGFEKVLKNQIAWNNANKAPKQHQMIEPKKTVKEKLQELNELKEEGLITEAEFAEKKKVVLNNFVDTE
eukprot:TRINITY_DN92689_c0_g1_i1.p1 TRINITY_DN92689_c0_g1~~TRINITY_DN92689_c0_g1_i1.p1  ORF type:complete len:328 (+),score=63.53 TRINITY_DN92689_c0_g1_i1:70-1053(+)